MSMDGHDDRAKENRAACMKKDGFKTRTIKASSGTPSYSLRIPKHEAGTKPKVG